MNCWNLWKLGASRLRRTSLEIDANACRGVTKVTLVQGRDPSSFRYADLSAFVVTGSLYQSTSGFNEYSSRKLHVSVSPKQEWHDLYSAVCRDSEAVG